MSTNRKKDIRNLTLLVGSMLPILATQSTAPALPAMAAAFPEVPNADFIVRLSLTMPALVIAFAALFSGALLDRWGRRPVLIVSLVIFAVAGSAGFVLNSLPAILISRALLGLAVAGTMNGFTTLITDYFTGTRLNQFMGYQGAAIGVGGVIFLLVAGVITEAGWRYPFLLHLFALLVLGGVLYALEEPDFKVDSPGEAGAEPARTRFPLRSVAIIYAVGFFFMLLYSVVPVQLPFLLTSLVGVGASQVGLALAVPTLSSIIFSLQFQRFKARLSFQMISSIFSLALGVGFLVIASSTSFGIVLLGLAIIGIGLGLIVPNINVWITSVTTPAVRGLAFGGLTMCIFIGQFLTPIVSQPILVQLGLRQLFAISGVVALGFTVFFVVISLRKSPTPEAQVQSSDLTVPTFPRGSFAEPPLTPSLSGEGEEGGQRQGRREM